MSKGLLSKINAIRLLEFFNEVVQQRIVEILSSQESVSIRCLHFEDAVSDLENGDIESSSSQIIHGNDATVLLKRVSSGLKEREG